MRHPRNWLAKADPISSACRARQYTRQPIRHAVRSRLTAEALLETLRALRQMAGLDETVSRRRSR